MHQTFYIQPLSQGAGQSSGSNGKERCQRRAQKYETEKHRRLQHGQQRGYRDNPSQQMFCYGTKGGPNGNWPVDEWHASTGIRVYEG